MVQNEGFQAGNTEPYFRWYLIANDAQIKGEFWTYKGYVNRLSNNYV